MCNSSSVLNSVVESREVMHVSIFIESTRSILISCSASILKTDLRFIRKLMQNTMCSQTDVIKAKTHNGAAHDGLQHLKSETT